MIDNLMVEDWNDQISFESYFEECNPFLCTYSYDLRGDSNYVFAITIGLIGGLTTILKLIIPFIITIIRRWRQKRRMNINESMVDTVLQSDLRCFFDVHCLQKLVDSLSLINISVSDIVLNLTTSHYQANSSLLNIFSNIMVEEWNNQTFYNDYFNICQPSVCIATYISRGNIIYIVTTTIGLIGGLTKIYRFSLPLLMKIILRFIIPCIRKRCGTRHNVGAVRNA